jgi:hypothetical protein
MKYEILLNSILRLPMNEATKLLDEYQEKVGFKNFSEQQKVLDILTHKHNSKCQIKNEAFNIMLLSLAYMVKEKSMWSKAAFENIKSYPMIVWIECIGCMDKKDIITLLNNYHKELPEELIETCIINLNEQQQVQVIDKYKNKLNNSKMYYNFFFSVKDKARLKLQELFPNKIKDTILLELQDLEEKEVIDKLESESTRLNNIEIDELLEFILLKSRRIETLNKFIELYNNKINNCSTSKFKLLLSRYKYISNNITNNKDKIITDNKLFNLFKNKFHEIGLEETLKLFDNRTNYKSNPFTVEVILEFLDLSYEDNNIKEYINEETIKELINKYVFVCNSKEYNLEEFEKLVKNINLNNKTKLIHDDYIEAIIACGYLLRNNLINDKNELFLELRDKFSKDIITRSIKDNTYTDNINLNGLFYRLAKGTIPFSKVYMIKTYKGLIFLTKSGELIDNADYITNFLSDYQVAKLNIKPLINWKKTVERTNTNADNLSFIERMGLQLLCYFGESKGKYLLESNMQGNRMENLFDGLNYQDITINDNGIPNINIDLINYLFGKGILKENKSIINKMIRGEIPYFEKYFTEFCNSYSKIKDKCNGVLSIKRIIDYFDDVELPIKLNPDEIVFKNALKEMNTNNEELLKEAVELLKDGRNRTYSTIPKVKGTLGDFKYEILDLDNPLAIAVGYLSHCCFVVGGISYSALKYSIQSVNGRTFVVYYKGEFIAQSWVWRNGDVICFDSVEAGSPYHEAYYDDIKIVDVYKQAAKELLNKSYQEEDEIQRVKIVTVGKSDYLFKDLSLFKGDVPRPLEQDIYVYDSSNQKILVGSNIDEIRYGNVGVQYKDPRPRVITINNLNNTDIDTIDELNININALRYRINNELPVNLSDYNKLIYGKDWYILINNDNSIETGILNNNEIANKEYNNYLSRYSNENIKVKVK